MKEKALGFKRNRLGAAALFLTLFIHKVRHGADAEENEAWPFQEKGSAHGGISSEILEIGADVQKAKAA
jgi:hypothetical protein